MKQLKMILMAILAICGRLFALPTSAAHNGGGKSGGFNFLPVLCIVFAFGLLTACGGGGGNIGNANSLGVGSSNTWHKSKDGADNLQAVQSVCNHEAKQYADKRGEGYHVDLAWTINWHSNYNSAYPSCMARLGWIRR